MTAKPPPPTRPAKPPQKRADRVARETEALRANLHKRNEQRRARRKTGAK